MKQVKDTINNFFKWVKGTELVELTDIDAFKDRKYPELDLEEVIIERKIYGRLNDWDDIEAVVCVAYTNEVPHYC